MPSQKWMEALVGLFVLFAVITLTLLALKVSGLTSLFPEASYTVYADFEDIGNLKTKAPVKIGGVSIGEVTSIALDPATFKAIVGMHIKMQFNHIPDDSSAGIYTAGLLGDNYISITPMYSETFLKADSHIHYTHPAMILEKLIGQFIYKLSGDKHDEGNKK